MSDSQLIVTAVLGALSPLWFACFVAWAFWPHLSADDSDADA
ncbi:hypothetical protein [Methylobacterium sp. Leaf87]|nr:hypothetical protein [Methylobacterium sp. Leaf87]